MGSVVEAQCCKCGNAFTFQDGGGFTFHLVRCDSCGAEKHIGFDELGVLHLRYLKGLSGPYCLASAEHDKVVREKAQVEPVSEAEYHKGIETISGACNCGGRYRLDALPRCPKCRSTQISSGGTAACYD
jgi:hypothetical protein